VWSSDHLRKPPDSLPPVRAALISLGLVALLGISACGDDDGEGATTTPATTADGDACEQATAPEPKRVQLDPPPRQPSADELTAVVDTSCGTFEIALETKNSPKTTASFEYLAEEGVFDGTLWHRIVPGFVVQGGDPQGTGSGGPGYSVDEPPPPDAEYTRGVVAMAKSEVEPPGRSGSQFFVVTAPDAGLPAQYAIAGEVTSGFDVVKRIEGYGDPSSGGTGTPLEPVLINSVTIEEG
jgi:peptidyl-prolyl cis-trans isomerase B (cyclophilin B)